MIHQHKWKEFGLPDATGGFIYCQCGEMRFLSPKTLKKFKEYKKKKVKFEIR